jgi:hypothetical protein
VRVVLLCDLSIWHLYILTSGLWQANSINVCNFILLYRIYAGSLFYRKCCTQKVRPIRTLLHPINLLRPSLPLTCCSPVLRRTPYSSCSCSACSCSAAQSAAPTIVPVLISRARPVVPDATLAPPPAPRPATLTGAASSRRSTGPWRESPLASSPATAAAR